MGRTTGEMTGEEEEEGQTVVGGRVGRPGDARLMGDGGGTRGASQASRVSESISQWSQERIDVER